MVGRPELEVAGYLRNQRGPLLKEFHLVDSDGFFTDGGHEENACDKCLGSFTGILQSKIIHNLNNIVLLLMPI